jgi:hypothetical protein
MVFEEVRLAPGTRIIQAGDPVDTIFLLAQVRVCVVVVVGRGGTALCSCC